MTKKDRQKSIRLPSDVTDAVEKIAEAEDRSFAYIVEKALRFWLEAQRKPKARK